MGKKSCDNEENQPSGIEFKRGWRLEASPRFHENRVMLERIYYFEVIILQRATLTAFTNYYSTRFVTSYIHLVISLDFFAVH